MNQFIDSTVHPPVRVRTLTGMTSAAQRLSFPDRFGFASSHDYSGSPLYKGYNQAVKRMFDVVVSSAVAILVLSWMIPILWALNRLFYGYGVFFIQRRNGLNNRIFGCIKFKTMVDTNEADFKAATQNDPRVTPLGEFLRRTGLDELPQFLNVLTGQMSIIGPRPHMLYHTEAYSNILDHFMIRHTVKPGITGLAQVNGFRGSIRTLHHLRQRVVLDLAYVEKWNLWLDLKIFILTIIRIFRDGSDVH